MKKVNIFCDSILGSWNPDKKQTNKEFHAWSRTKQLKLDEQYCQDYYDPETKKLQKIFGEVILLEVKLVNKKTSEMSYSRLITPTTTSKIIPIV